MLSKCWYKVCFIWNYRNLKKNIKYTHAFVYKKDAIYYAIALTEINVGAFLEYEKVCSQAGLLFPKRELLKYFAIFMLTFEISFKNKAHFNIWLSFNRVKQAASPLEKIYAYYENILWHQSLNTILKKCHNCKAKFTEAAVYHQKLFECWFPRMYLIAFQNLVNKFATSAFITSILSPWSYMGILDGAGRN